MILLPHIIIALASVAFSTYAAFAPSQTKLRASYGLLAGTLITGTWLVVSSHAAILSACVTGLAYTGIVTTLLAVANRRLAKATVRR